MKRISAILLMLAVWIFAMNYSLAAVTTYNCAPISDTTIDAAAPITNFGTGPSISIAGSGAGGPARSIIRLNIPPFIAASQIESAYLNLYASGSGSVEINIHPITPSYYIWFEKDLYKPDTTQIVWGATWNDLGGEPRSYAWTTAGGDYDAGASSSATIAAGWNRIDITNLLSNRLVAIQKYGMLLKLQDEALNISQDINSRDNAAHQPYLELNVDLGLPERTHLCPAIADTYVDESLTDGEHNLNFNWKTRILVAYHPSYGKARGLWRFDIPNGILAADIVSARLFLSGSEHAPNTNQFIIDCYALDAPFNEETVTWDTLAGGGYDTTFFSSGTIYQILIDDPAFNWRAEIDVTDLLAGNLVKVRNNGILIKNQNETVKMHQNIASRESYDDSDVAAYIAIECSEDITSTTTTEPVVSSTTTVPEISTTSTIDNTTTSIISTTSTTTQNNDTTTSITSSTTTGRIPPCLVETIYGEDSEEVVILRYVRDKVLINTPEGREVIKLYYAWNPFIVRMIEKDPELQYELRQTIDELLHSILNY